MNFLRMADRLPHAWQVLATLLAVGALFSLGWSLSQSGALDLVATALSFFLLRLLGQLGWRPRTGGHFKGTSALVEQARRDYEAWSQSHGVLAQAVLALGWTVLFLVLRLLLAWLLGVVTTFWTALAAGLAVAAFVASPVLAQSVAGLFRGGAHRDPDES